MALTQQGDIVEEPSGSAVVSLSSTVSGHLPQHRQVGEEASFGLDYEDNGGEDEFSIGQNDGLQNQRSMRKRKSKGFQKGVNATQEATNDDGGSGTERSVSKVHSYRLEEWMTSSDEDDDECSDMISEDYSRQQQQEHDVLSSRRTRQQREEEDVICNMQIVVTSKENEDDSASSLSSLDSFRETGIDQDILSDSDPAIPYDDSNLLGQSHRSTGSEDRRVLFSPIMDEKLKDNFASPQGASRLVLKDDWPIEDHNDNDGNDDYNVNKKQLPVPTELPISARVSPRSIASSKKTGEKIQRRKGRRLPKSPPSNKSPASKSKTKRVVTPLWSPDQLPFGSEGSPPSLLFEENESSNDPSNNQLERLSPSSAREDKNACMSADDARQQCVLSDKSGKRWDKPPISISKKRHSNTKMPSPNAFFSPESHGRTFLPKHFQSDNPTRIDLPLPFGGNGASLSKSDSFDDRSSIAETATTSSVTSSRGLEYLDENGNRPAFISNVEYTAPLIDKSELPTTKTKKSLNRKRSCAQPQQEQETEKARNNMLLASLLSSNPSVEDERDFVSGSKSSIEPPERSSGVLPSSIDDVSVSRLSMSGSLTRSHVGAERDDSDEVSIMSEISADSIHRNVQVKRTNRKKKARKGKALNSSSTTSTRTTGNGLSSSTGIISNAKKKKAAKKARPKKRGENGGFSNTWRHDLRDENSGKFRRLKGSSKVPHDGDGREDRSHFEQQGFDLLWYRRKVACDCVNLETGDGDSSARSNTKERACQEQGNR